MKYNADIHHRRSIRLKGYDYAQAGAYFITICTQHRECLFGEVVNGNMRLSAVGDLVAHEWQRLNVRFADVRVDEFVVMPNHLHGILHLVGAQFIAPLSIVSNGTSANATNQDAINQGAINQGAINQGAINRAPTVGEIVRVFKAVTARMIRQTINPAFAWQRNYYEHIIRSDSSLASIREYIVNNPKQWVLDRENPANRNRYGGT